MKAFVKSLLYLAFWVVKGNLEKGEFFLQNCISVRRIGTKGSTVRGSVPGDRAGATARWEGKKNFLSACSRKAA